MLTLTESLIQSVQATTTKIVDPAVKWLSVDLDFKEIKQLSESGLDDILNSDPELFKDDVQRIRDLSVGETYKSDDNYLYIKIF